jgi:cell division septation protein DedD
VDNLSNNDPDNASWLRPLPEDLAEQSHYNKKKLVLMGLTAVFLSGFAIMIWLSYTSEIDEGGPIPVVRADGTVVKEKPIEPGGKEIPFQDKEVFDRVDNLPNQGGDVLASSAEIPLKRPVIEEPIVSEQEAAANEVVEEVTKVVETPKPAAIPVKAASTGGDFMIQIGAFADRKIAETHWAAVKSKNNAVLSNLSPTYMRVDLGDSGIFYRVRGGMLVDRVAADKVCAGLKKNNQTCLVVTK